jgi:hypothetical protein
VCEVGHPKGQTPVLQYSFTWKQLSAIAGISFWNIYFKLVHGAFRAADAGLMEQQGLECSG